MFSLFRKKTAESVMGRWGMINDKTKLAPINVDWANHDHCGGEICNVFFKNNMKNTQIKSNSNIKTLNKKETIEFNNEKYKDVKSIESDTFAYKDKDDYYLPYTL